MISSLILSATGVFAASVLRGFAGFGFGLAAVPLLSLALPPAQVVPLAVTLQVIVGIAGLRGASVKCEWPAVGMLLPGLLVGVPMGLLMLTEIPANPVRLVIGAIIACSVWLIHHGIRLPASAPFPRNRTYVSCRNRCTSPLFSVACSSPKFAA